MLLLLEHFQKTSCFISLKASRGNYMKVNLLDIKGTWRSIADSARTTIGLEAGKGEPSSSWKRRMLLCEHSPTRKLLISWKWYDLKYWVSTHFVRHKFGIEHWVRTQRTDRTGENRNHIEQGATVEHEAEANAQSIINISRKRLCTQASPETRQAWQEFLTSIEDKEPELVKVCVPDCVYRGWCYEYISCNYHLTPQFKDALNSHREGINQWEGK